MKKLILANSPRFWSKVRGYELHKKFITYMSLNQVSKCDANCQGCFRYLDRKNGLTNLLGISDYIRLIEEFKENGGLAIEISGEGEPLFHGDNTMSIIRYASSLDIWTTSITNGHFLTKDLVKELKSLQVALVISLHSLKKDIYEKDNGCLNSFEVVMNAIDIVSKLFQGTSWMENDYEIKRACIHWTLQKNNLDEILSVKNFCNKKGLHFSVAPLANVGHAINNIDIQLPNELSDLPKVNDIGDESIIFYDEPDGRVVCGTCKYGLNVGADGNLLLDAHGGYEVNIANMRDINFKNAVELQHSFSKKMFNELSSFCPLRDSDWNKFLQNKSYL